MSLCVLSDYRPTRASCSEFLCADKSACLKRHFVCDGKQDCADNSDEQPSCGRLYAAKIKETDILKVIYRTYY